jgi:hypothetical protein
LVKGGVNTPPAKQKIYSQQGTSDWLSCEIAQNEPGRVSLQGDRTDLAERPMKVRHFS